MPVTIIIPTVKGRRERLMECINAIRDNANYPHKILIYENEDKGWVKAMINAVDNINGMIYVSNDDMVMQKDCLKLLVEAYEENDVELLYPDDTINNGTIATSFLCNADYFRKYFHAGYNHNYGDTELTEIARLQGKLMYVPKAVSIHKHWTMGAPKDETYKLQDTTISVDRELYNERRKHNFYI